jgi:virginiamycin B lyase
MTTAGALTQFSLPSNTGTPVQIAASYDGTLWFTGQPQKLIWRITTAGAVASYSTSGNPVGITQGPDGAIWFTESSRSSATGAVLSSWIGRFDGNANLTEFPLPAAAGNLTTGPDGALWFTTGTSVGRMTTNGVVATFATPGNTPGGIAVGPDGALWFTDSVNSQIVRITTTGAITPYPTPTPTSAPTSITAGPDGSMWFVESTADAIGRLAVAKSTPPSTLQITTPYLLPNGAAGTLYSLTLTATGGTPPYTWSTTASLPFGLSLSSAGVISGRSTSAGASTFGISVTDSSSSTTSLLFALDISPANCTYAIGTPPPISAAGTPTGAFEIVTGQTCPWSVSAAPSWVTFPKGSNGSSSSALTFGAQPNYGPNPRSGTITISGMNVTVTQQAGLIPNSGFMPHLAAEGGWTTTFTLVNKGSFGADAQMSLLDDNGNPLALPLSFPQQSLGPFTEASVDETIPPNASLIVQASGPANVPYVEGSAQTTSAGAVDGFAIFHYNPSGQEAIVPLQSAGSGIVVPFDNTNGVLTGIAVENGNNQAATFPVVLRDDTGAPIGTGMETIQVGANGHTSFVLSTQFPVTANIRGTIEIVPDSYSTAAITGDPSNSTIVLLQPTILGIRYTPPGTLTTLPALPAAANHTSGGLIPHIAAGNGWQTTFVIVNTGSTLQQQAELNFSDDNGNPLPLPITVFETGGSTTTSSLSLPIPPNASRWIQTTASTASALLTGSAQLSAGVSGFAIYRYNPNGQEAVVPLETRNAGTYLIPFDNTNGTNTGIALSVQSLQPSVTPIGVPVLVRDDSGNQVTAATIPVAANGHISQVLTTLLPSTANIRGTVEFDTPQGATISVLGIRSPPALTFTTLPALAR